MKKIYLLLAITGMGFMISCGGEEKKSDKKDKGESKEEEPEEIAEEEPEIDYSYVIPAIDTSSLNSEEEILSAMDKVITARKMDDSLSENVTGYDGYYVELTNLYSSVLNKSTQYMGTLKGKDAIMFNEKLNAITEKMYK